jgi:uncharacterized protein (DUF433 family)
MDWRDHIHSDSDIAAGKPVVQGTRLSVDFILDLLAEGWSEEEILENYPSLSPTDLRAVFAYTAECMRDEQYHPFERGA